MKKSTPKRAALQRLINQAKREIREERDPMCEGCGRWDKPLDVSHHIGLGQTLTYAADKNNMALMCRSCHHHVEAGRYHELANGAEIIAYIRPREPHLLKHLTQH